MKKIKVYLAGGWFNIPQLVAIETIEKIVANNSLFEVYSPRKDEQPNVLDEDTQKLIFKRNLEHIQSSNLIIASTVLKDMGTLWECGYAYAYKIPIIYTNFDVIPLKSFNLMLSQSGHATFVDPGIFRDFIMSFKNDIEVLDFIYGNKKYDKYKFKGEIE